MKLLGLLFLGVVERLGSSVVTVMAACVWLMGATGDELGKKIESEIGLVSGMNLYLFSFHVETNKLCFQVDLKIAHVAPDLNKLFETTRESFVSLNPQPTMSFA